MNYESVTLLLQQCDFVFAAGHIIFTYLKRSNFGDNIIGSFCFDLSSRFDYL